MPDVPAWLAALGVIVPPVSGLGGYWLAGRNEEARDERAAAREAQARLANREDLLEDERQAFQRDVLLELQEAMLAQTTTTTEVLLQTRRTSKEKGQTYSVPHDLDQRSHQARVALLRLGERVLGDHLRQELNALQKFAAEAELLPIHLRGTDPEKAIARLDAAMGELGERHKRVNEILGRELRAVLGRSASASD